MNRKMLPIIHHTVHSLMYLDICDLPGSMGYSKIASGEAMTASPFVAGQPNPSDAR